jgi:hypothetical protein
LAQKEESFVWEFGLKHLGQAFVSKASEKQPTAKQWAPLVLKRKQTNEKPFLFTAFALQGNGFKTNASYSRFGQEQNVGSSAVALDQLGRRREWDPSQRAEAFGRLLGTLD